jgi:hypothetical protein
MRLIIVGCLLAVLSPIVVSQTEAPTRLSGLGWLSGCWEMKNEKRGTRITEMWMKRAGDAMLGVGRTLKAGKLIDFEFLRIVEDADSLSYVSRPSSNKEDTAFKMIRSAANEVVFENPNHDFPQRILYKREGDKMKARIEGSANGKTRGVDFLYTRVLCN